MIKNRPDPNKLYYQKQSPTWWLKDKRYTLFMLREVSSLFVLIYLIGVLRTLSTGGNLEDLYSTQNPLMLLLNVIILGFAIFHSITWFKLAAVVLKVKIGSKVVPASMVSAAHFGMWLVASVVIAYVFWFAPAST